MQKKKKLIPADFDTSK